MNKKFFPFVIVLLYSFIVSYILSTTIEHYGIMQNSFSKTMTVLGTTIVIVIFTIILFQLIVTKANNE